MLNEFSYETEKIQPAEQTSTTMSNEISTEFETMNKVEAIVRKQIWEKNSDREVLLLFMRELRD